MQPLDMNKGGFSEWGCPAACGSVTDMEENKLAWLMSLPISGSAADALPVTEKGATCPCGSRGLFSARQWQASGRQDGPMQWRYKASCYLGCFFSPCLQNKTHWCLHTVPGPVPAARGKNKDGWRGAGSTAEGTWGSIPYQTGLICSQRGADTGRC